MSQGQIPAGGTAAAQAERIASRVFLASRVGQALFSASMIANDRRRFRNARLQVAIFAALSAESAWLGRRLLRAGRYDDRPAMWLDAACSSLGLLLSERGLGERAAPWVKNFAIGSAIGAASGRGVGDAVGAVGLLGAAALAVGLRPQGRDAPVAGPALAANDVISWSGMSAAARAYLAAHRRYARDRDEADALAVQRAAAAAAEGERSRQQEQLHRVTIDVLHRVAGTADLAAAQRIARAEAGRLRYALRTGGQLPHQLSAALADVVDDAPLHVDLVTAELDDGMSLGPPSVAALGNAVRAALSTAAELGAAQTAVVRAYPDGAAVRVSVRDHGTGYDPDAGGEYAARLAAVRDLVRAVGGDAQAWTQPGAGVRVDLEVPSADAGVDDAQQRGPHVRVRTGPAGDDEDPVVVGDVEVGGREGLDRTQDEVRVQRVGELHAGVPNDPLQPGAQQRSLRADEDGGRASHLSRLTDLVRARVGSSAQFHALSATEQRRAHRTVLAALLAWRATGLGTGVASVLGGAGRYRSRVVALGQLGAGLAESAWLAGRLSRRDRWDDPVAAAVDAGTAVGLLALSRGNLAAAERGTWINWVPWSFAASAVSAQAMAEHRPARRAAGVAAITAAHAAQGPAPGDAIANSVAQAGFAVGAWFLAAQTRAGAVRLAVARAAAVEQGRRLAQARERGTQLRLLHDSALQTLEAVAGGRYHDRAALSERASAEARLLARALEGRGPSAPLELLLAAVAEQQRARGLQVELDAADLPPLPDEVGEALAAACHEALTNVAKHAGVTTARVQVRAQAGGIMLMVEDGGAGFEPHTMGRGFGMAESVHGRMREVGGLAEVRSRPGVGTRVLLRWPA